MTLEDLGYYPDLENFRKKENLDSFDVGRVISEHKERYLVKTTENEYEAEILGNFRYSAQIRSDFPAVGDWVAISEYDENKVLIHAILPRKSIIERQNPGKHGEKQVIATNVDYAFIVQAVDRDFNLNRLERYLAICYNSKVIPIILLNKIDLIRESELKDLLHLVQERIEKVPVLAFSNESGDGMKELKSLLEKGKTYCMLGSSGVGKSTLLNNLSGSLLMKTADISQSTNKGRHRTTHRELIVLKSGGIIIDNPGIREVGIADAGAGIESTFNDIVEFSKECRFKDCTHTGEMGCAVISALDRGEIDKDSYNNYLKMEREKSHYESTIAEKRKKDKDLGKMIKHYKKTRKSDKY